MFAFDKKDGPVVRTSLLALIAFAIMSYFGMLPGAHAQSFGQADLPSYQARSALGVLRGTVMDVQETSIEVQASEGGKTAGTLIGGLIGAVVGANESSGAGQVLAAGLGAFGGNHIASAMGHEMRPASEVIVQLSSGQLIDVVQEMNGTPVVVGDAVYVVGSYPALRVIRASQVARANTTPQHINP